jgi:AcrR family transcriptional regulator
MRPGKAAFRADRPTKPASRPAPRRTQDPEGVKRNILEVAHREFVEKGLSGARVDDIAAATATSKRMIYYYFGDKEGLYRAVLERAYAGIRDLERTLDPALPPAAALAAHVGMSFDYHADNPDFVRLVMVENIHRARHLEGASHISERNLSVIRMLRGIYERGVAEGAFRAGLDPLDLHLTISALSFYNVSNRCTIREIFGHDMGAPEARAARRASVIDAVLRYVRKG